MKTASTTIRIPAEMHETLRGLAQERQSTLQGVLVEAIDLYRRERFVLRVNAAYESLRDEPEAWKAHLAERAEWDTTIADGLLPTQAPRPARKNHRPGRAARRRGVVPEDKGLRFPGD